MTNELSNPFEFEYDEQTDNIQTKSTIKFFRNYKNLDKTKEYIKINFNIYKIDKPVDLFTWLNEPDSETNYQIDLYFELDTKFIELDTKLLVDKNNLNSYTYSDTESNTEPNTESITDFDTDIDTDLDYDSDIDSIEFEKSKLNDLWFNSWYLKSRYATDKIKLNDTYIPTTVEFIRFV